MKNILKNIFIIFSFFFTHSLIPSDKVIPLSAPVKTDHMVMHPAMINIKLISLEAKTWWVAEKLKIKSLDPEQKMLIEQVQQNSITMKKLLMEDLKKRLCEQESAE